MKYTILPLLALLVLVGAGCEHPAVKQAKEQVHTGNANEGLLVHGTATATFAGGCFWCSESAFEKVPGVTEAVSGYAAGTGGQPDYQSVAQGKTDFVEAVQVTYDPRVVSYQELLEAYWRHINPTDISGQFADRGAQYQPRIFPATDKERREAEESKALLERSGTFDDPILVPIEDFSNFFPAEDYHQDYYKNNSAHYQAYEEGSGRAPFIRNNWHMTNKYTKPSDDELKKTLTPLQYTVTQEAGTEPPGNNEYNNNKEPGIYVDIVTGEPLFSSTDKFDSKSGWPSFTKPITGTELEKKTDYDIGVPRTEVRSKSGDSHLGHVFQDGPKEETGLRYCINSAAMKFIPKDKLEEEGYGEYLYLFE